MFFECPITKSYRPKLESTRLGLLSVTGGELSIPGIIAQLQRLVPVENFAWECRQVGHNVFKVTFPDKDEIDRLARFGTFHVPNSSIKLDFQQCVSSMEPTSKLPEIWILMSGIPQRRIGDFLAMWSLGTLFGKTLKVDMKYAREKGILRILVGCLDYRRIPAKERIYIADGFYDISFVVEAKKDIVMTSVDIPEDDPSDHNDHGNNDDNSSENQKTPDVMETDAAHGRLDQNGTNNATSNGPDINKLAGEFSSGVKFSPRVKRMMELSKIEIAAFIASLSPDAVAAEAVPNSAAAQTESSGTESVPAACSHAAAAEKRDVSAAATDSAGESASHRTAAAAGAENSAPLLQPAGAISPVSVGVAETGVPAVARISAVASDSTAADTQVPSPVTRAAMTASSAATLGTSAEATSSFRPSSDRSGAFLQGQKTPSPPLSAAKETASFSPSTRDDGFCSPKLAASSLTRQKKEKPIVSEAPWIATSHLSPPAPSSKPRKTEDVIAFGGISEKIGSPVRSSQRVRMQHNGDATQMERATQLAERRMHAVTPGTKSNLSFSKFSDSEIETRATSLGVSLGSDASETKRSICALKMLEEDRRITYLTNNLNENLGKETDCGIICTANRLSSDLAIEDRDEPVGDCSDPILDLPIKMLTKKNKKKVSTVGVSVRRSTRIIKKSLK
jgi:hypothetical protein